MVSPLAGVPTHLDKLDLAAAKDPEKMRTQYKVGGGVGGGGGSQWARQLVSSSLSRRCAAGWVGAACWVPGSLAGDVMPAHLHSARRSSRS